GAVASSVTAPVQAMAIGTPGRSGDGRDTAEGSKSSFIADSIGVAPNGDDKLCSHDRTGSIDVQDLWVVIVEDYSHLLCDLIRSVHSVSTYSGELLQGMNDCRGWAINLLSWSAGSQTFNQNSSAQ